MAREAAEGIVVTVSRGKVLLACDEVDDKVRRFAADYLSDRGHEANSTGSHIEVIDPNSRDITQPEVAEDLTRQAERAIGLALKLRADLDAGRGNPADWWVSEGIGYFLVGDYGDSFRVWPDFHPRLQAFVDGIEKAKGLPR